MDAGTEERQAGGRQVKRRPRWLEYLTAMVIGGLVLAAICGVFYAHREIGIYLSQRPWQKGEVEELANRFTGAAARGDVAAVRECVDERSLGVVENAGGGPAVELPGPQGKTRRSLKEVGALGKIEVRDIEVMYPGEGGLLARGRGAAGSEVRFRMARGAEGLRILVVSW